MLVPGICSEVGFVPRVAREMTVSLMALDSDSNINFSLARKLVAPALKYSAQKTSKRRSDIGMVAKGVGELSQTAKHSTSI